MICAGQRPQWPVRALDPTGVALMGRRVEAKLTTRQLAELAGVSAMTISRLENGTSSVSPQTWARIDAAIEGAMASKVEPQ